MMKYFYQAVLVFMVLIFTITCNKEEEKDYNMLKITSGAHTGFAYAYYPNRGYWSDIKGTARYVHLVFGATDNMITGGKDIMSIQFYDEGSGSIAFPSAQGQHANFGITVDGNERYYTVENATLTISEFTADRLTGYISGTFISNGPEFESVNITMDIDIEMVQL